MRSALPKVLHPICGRPMILWPLLAARAAGAERVIVVDNPKRRLAAALPDDVEIAVQEQPRGTGDAVAAALGMLEPGAPVLVINGDMPLITGEAIASLVASHEDVRARRHAGDHGARRPGGLRPDRARCARRRRARRRDEGRGRRHGRRARHPRGQRGPVPLRRRRAGSPRSPGSTPTTPRASCTCPTSCRSCAPATASSRRTCSRTPTSRSASTTASTSRPSRGSRRTGSTAATSAPG